MLGDVVFLTISIHAPREGCDSLLVCTRSACVPFQSTHPARGATRGWVWCSPRRRNFNPRTPRGVRPHHIIDLYLCAFISIHAPREGCDAFLPRSGRPADHFNPRTPRGVRLQAFSALKEEREFQSTHPARGATGLLPYTRSWSRYFNPRTPRGVRPGGRSKPARQMRFQSTHPARGATGQGRIVTGRLTFQSTHPARGATATCWRRPFLAANFNPRTPRGVRRLLLLFCFKFQVISIHAPREGCDRGLQQRLWLWLLFQSTHPARGATTSGRAYRALTTKFQSTHPARGATLGEQQGCPSMRFQSTHPARGATSKVDLVFQQAKISIHAPREGCDLG